MINRLFFLTIALCSLSCQQKQNKIEADRDVQEGYEKMAMEYKTLNLNECKRSILIKADSLAKIMVEEDLLNATYLDSLPQFPAKPKVDYKKEKTKEFNPSKLNN